MRQILPGRVGFGNHLRWSCVRLGPHRALGSHGLPRDGSLRSLHCVCAAAKLEGVHPAPHRTFALRRFLGLLLTGLKKQILDAFLILLFNSFLEIQLELKTNK